MAHQERMEQQVKRDRVVHRVWLVSLASPGPEEHQVQMAVLEKRESKENQAYLGNEATKETPE